MEGTPASRVVVLSRGGVVVFSEGAVETVFWATDEVSEVVDVDVGCVSADAVRDQDCESMEVVNGSPLMSSSR